MRTARVVTNLRCNQACTYCDVRRATDDLSAIAPAAILRKIDEARAAGAGEVLLGGGEPTLRRDLEALVAHAARGGAVTLETNATSIDEARARALAAAGLSLARVNLAGSGDALDEVTRDPGGFEATLRGLRALSAAGVPVELSAAVTRRTAPLLPALPPRLAGALPVAPRALVATVPVRAPDPDELLPYEEAAEVLLRLERAGRGAGLPVRLAPDSGPPPCLFPRPLRAPHLWSFSPGGHDRPGHVRPESCARCRLADRCPGLPAAYVERRGLPAPAPIEDDRDRRRLTVISSVAEQVERELVSKNVSRDPVRGEVREAIVRIAFACNQACRFCFVSTHLPAPPYERVARAIVEAASRGEKITLSGGEPTLHPRLLDLVRLARAHSALPVQLQTNATRVDAALARALEEAGLAEAFVSLHGSEAARSDAITAAAGTFEETARGLDALAATSVELYLNYVVCASNLDDLLPTTRLVARRWPRAYLNLSFVAASSDLVPKDRDLVPRYADVLPVLADAVAEARAAGLRVGGLQSMCGIPLCLVPPSLAPSLLAEIPPGFDGGEFQKVEACSGCAKEARCFGIRRGYAELHGTSELRRL